MQTWLQILCRHMYPGLDMVITIELMYAHIYV